MTIQLCPLDLPKCFFLNSSIEDLVVIYGGEAERHFLCCCLAVLDFAGVGNGEGSASGSNKSSNLSKEKDRELIQLLAEYFGPCITQPSFPSLLTSALEQPLRNHFPRNSQTQLKSSSAFITHLCRSLRLTRSQELVLRISLVEACGPESRSQSLPVVRQRLGELLKNFADQERHTAPLEGGLQVASRFCLADLRDTHFFNELSGIFSRSYSLSSLSSLN